jgi:hypothetical protein
MNDAIIRNPFYQTIPLTALYLTGIKGMKGMGKAEIPDNILSLGFGLKILSHFIPNILVKLSRFYRGRDCFAGLRYPVSPRND